MSYTITLIPGDGIGPEVTAAAVRVLQAPRLLHSRGLEAQMPARQQAMRGGTCD